MIIKRTIDKEELENAAGEMCRWYCRFPLLWDEQVMGQELSESELCRNCPMNELIKGAVIEEYPQGHNDWQE